MRCANTSEFLCRYPAGGTGCAAQLALTWMERLAQFRPYLGGAVWHGTATRLSDIYIQLFCDDPKSAEIALIENHVDYEPARYRLQRRAGRGLEPVERQPRIGRGHRRALMIYDHDDVRGALRPDAKGRAPRGDWPRFARCWKIEPRE